MAKISIIVPVYKVEEYLPRCIDSILVQTFSDFELILVDDGSPDNCGKICDEYAKNDDRIVVIHKDNGGLSDARNAGINVATGEYIGFVDSDDWIDPNMYCVLYENAINNRADISECFFMRCSDRVIAKQPKKVIEKILSKENAIIELYNNDNYGSITVTNKLFKKSLFDIIKFPFGKINEDQFVTPKLFYYANCVVFCNYIGYYYFSRQNSIMNSDFSLKKLDAVYAYKDNRDFLIEHDMLKSLEYLDAIYQRVILKYIRLSLENGFDKKCGEIHFMIKEFDSLLFEFLKNKHLSYKEKIFLIMERIKIAL